MIENPKRPSTLTRDRPLSDVPSNFDGPSTFPPLKIEISLDFTHDDSPNHFVPELILVHFLIQK